MIAIEKIKKLPDAPGVYLFKNSRGKILYVGKATSLRSRVRSYFSDELLLTRGPLVVKMIELATAVDFVPTDSVLEALILEANLIKKHQPFHNTKEKDDKSYNFVVITDELFPRVLVMRGRELEKKSAGGVGANIPKFAKNIFGPFPNGSALRIAMKIIRRIFPFRDKCEPGTRPCFNRQIGLCPGVCSGEISAKEYDRTIRHLVMFFEGRKKQLLASLNAEMKSLAKEKAFEKAALVKKTVFALRHIQDVALIGRDKPAGAGSRIEAYDIAHLGGASTVGVMVVVENGEKKPADYRMFKIRQATRGDDLKALAEVLTRRFSHPEWPTPALVVIDGGQTHLDTAVGILNNLGVRVPVVSVVKDDKHKAREILGDGGAGGNGDAGGGVSAPAADQSAILLANNEAHRFAIQYHKKVRNRNFLS